MMGQRRNPDTKWTQVSGDVGASEYGALFGRWRFGGYELVGIEYMPNHSSEFDHLARPYWVQLADYSPDDLQSEDAERAKRSWGMADDFAWTPELVAEALFSYGTGVDQEQRYDGGNGNRTLREAMDRHGIPASALWRPSEYGAPNSNAEDVVEIED